MFAATPPRLITSESTRNDSAILSSLSGDQLLDKPPGERHQVIGRDRSGDCNAHGGPFDGGVTDQVGCIGPEDVRA